MRAEAAHTVAVTAGPHAFRALREGAAGRVHSLFERSLYVRLDGQLICLGPPGLGDGPLNLLCEPFSREVTQKLRIDEIVRFASASLRLGPSLVIDCAHVAEWRPRAIEAATALPGLELLRPHLNQLPVEGLARLMRNPQSGDNTPELRLARPAAQALADCVRNSATTAPPDLIALLGLGPGLTPSGDDFLGGAMIALAALSRHAQRDAIWRLIEPHLAERTTDISAAHLRAAAEGFGNAALHDCLAALFANGAETMPAAFNALAAIGHTSGLDALAGAVIVLRAFGTAQC